MDRSRYKRGRVLASEPTKKFLALLTLALSHLDPDCCHADWFRIGAALHSSTQGCEDGLEIFDDWSSRGRKYPGRRRIEYQWQCYDRGPGTIGIGTIRHYLKEEGVSWTALEAEVEERLGHIADD
jgi:hypothetical protein